MKERMMIRLAKPEGRKRITVSLPAALVRRIRQKSRQTSSTRSAVVEQMLLDAERQRQRRALRKEIEDYYRNQTPDEREEDRAWARAGAAAWKRDTELAKDEW